MQTLKFAARPAVLVLLWIVVSVHTISELSTVDPALRTAEASAGATPAPPHRALPGAAAFSRRPVPAR